MITVCSIFRNSAHYIPRYFAQMRALAEKVDVCLLLTHGDCSDDTEAALRWEAHWEGWNGALMIAQCDHGGPNFGSIDHPQRWDQIARVVRRTLDMVGDTPGDALVWVESDLLWDVDTMLGLLADLDRVPAVAPRVLAEHGDRWYDTWGYRRDGAIFSGHPPYHQGAPDPEAGLVKIDSCGSCWATTGDYWRTWSGHWPYTAGGDLWLDERLTIRHPD